MKVFLKKYGLLIFTLILIFGIGVLVESEAEVVAWALFSVALVIIVFLIERIKQERRMAALKQLQLQTEAITLRSQLNPHFFFNTLNNLYSLALTEPEKTPKIILKLSDLMRYTIYKGEEKKVYLEEEWKYIQDYVALQKIRFKDAPNIELKATFKEKKLRIAPLLLINLVENAFKHGLEKTPDEGFVRINLKGKSEVILFEIVNYFEEDTAHEAGFGLSNLQRRLELLYPNTHELKIAKTENTFTAQLTLYNV